ncbi:MAG: riboflavin synthase [Gammaproteobacteria bacterium]|nr:riboflavin synthase [Gammaproteobacteria bacterium]
MFTGIIQAVGRVQSMRDVGGDRRLVITADAGFLHGVQLGDSIATQGVCLTAVELTATSFAADVSRETLAHSTLGSLRSGSEVNLEKALTLSTPLGGHLVSGHVDGVGEVEARWDDARSIRFRLRAPDTLARYIAAKGSITVDGISLTVNAVQGACFELNLVPHTLAVTTAKAWQPGVKVNLEVDIIARYLERLLQGGSAAKEGGGVSEEFLLRCGFGQR